MAVMATPPDTTIEERMMRHREPEEPDWWGWILSR
jgi:hypothetical protein